MADVVPMSESEMADFRRYLADPENNSCESHSDESMRRVFVTFDRLVSDLERECAELRKDVSALKRTYGTEVAGLTAQLRDAGEVLVQAAANASDRTAAASHDPLSEAILMGCAERCFALSGRASSEVVGNMAPPLRPIRRETP